MTFRSLATLLGGVPADTGDTPGEPVGTRFVGFGEALTSAIANRPHYGLAENTDDLNTRVAAWETGGLDAAYDLGAAAVPGGGRVINVDTGAVQGDSSLTAQYQSDPANAMFRAELRNDTLAGAVGFESVSKDSLVTCGFMDRIPVDLSDDTIISATGALATLNPAGAGVTQIRLDGGDRWKNGTLTNLAQQFDIVEIDGVSVGVNGLYILNAFISDTVATFTRLDGTSPTFGADTAAQIALYKRRFSSAQFNIGTRKGSLFMGVPGDLAALMLMASKGDDTDPGGSDNALMTILRDLNGTVNNSLSIDQYGRLNSLLDNDHLADVGIQDDRFGYYALYADRVNTASALYDSGYIYRGANAPINHYASTALVGMGGDGQLDELETYSFTATGDEIDVTGATGAVTFQARILNDLTFCEIITPAAQAGYYYVSDKIGAATTVLQLRKLDGSAPSFPGSGTGLITFLSGVSAGKRSVLNLAQSPTGATSFPGLLRPSMTMMGCVDSTGVTGGLVIGIPPFTLSSPLRIYAGGTDVDQMLFGITYQGHGYLFGDMRIEGDYEYDDVTSRQRVVSVPLTKAQPESASGTARWDYIAGTWNPNVTGAIIFVPIEVPTGAEIVQVQVLIFNQEAETGGNRWAVGLRRMSLPWTTSAPSLDNILVNTGQSAVFVDGTITTRSVTTLTPDATLTVNDKDQDHYLLAVFGPNTPNAADLLEGVRVTFTDPGPRNF